MDSTSVLSWLGILYQYAKELVVRWEPSQLFSPCFQELSKFNEKLHFLRVLYISICGQFCAREYLCKSDRCQNPVPKKIKARMYCVLAFNMKWWVATQMEFSISFSPARAFKAGGKASCCNLVLRGDLMARYAGWHKRILQKIDWQIWFADALREKPPSLGMALWFIVHFIHLRTF